MSMKDALISQVALGLRLVRRMRARSGERAAIVGGGPLAETLRAVLEGAGVRVEALDMPTSEALARVTLVVDVTGVPDVRTALLEHAPRLARVAFVGAGAGRLADVDFYRTVHQRGLEVTGLSETTPAAADAVAAAEWVRAHA
jgi:threonine dehydrogenase-like Zn-dependent dehydrogenase